MPKVPISDDDYERLVRDFLASPYTPNSAKKDFLDSLTARYEPDFFGTDSTNPYTLPAYQPPKVYGQTLRGRSAYGYISPTDIDAGGRYSYQEPEVDEQGVYYGYKILKRHCKSYSCDLFASPSYYIEWVNGKVVAHELPSNFTMAGIHFTKRPDHQELANYIPDGGNLMGYAYSVFPRNGFRLQGWALVKCALYGDAIIETEQGFRAHKAMIVGVYDNGNWRSYQDYQECARAYSSVYPKQGWSDLP